MASYTIKGRRFLRKYTAGTKSPTYASLAEATKVANTLCDVDWVEVEGNVAATFPAHSGVTTTDDENLKNREYFDAALFCTDHADGMHLAHANAACYRFVLPDAAVGVSLTELRATIFSDPYNANGARVALYTSSSADIPTACATCRKGSSSDESASAQTNNGTASTDPTEWYSTNTHVEGAAPRRESDSMWYAKEGRAFIRPAGGLTLQKYLFVFVLLENYAYARNGYLEGSSYASAAFSMTTATDISGWTDGDTEECESAGGTFNVVSGGVYPDNLSGISGVETIQLQRTGDVLQSKLTPSPIVGDDGLRRLSAGVFAQLLNVSADSITYIGTTVMSHTDGSFNTYVVVAGDFDDGTIEEIPGIYFYDPRKLSFLPKSTASTSDVTVDPALATFARIHGGFACVSIASCSYDFSKSGSSSGAHNGNGLAFIGKDGTFNSRFNEQGSYPYLFFSLTNDGVISAVSQPTIVSYNLGSKFGFSDVEIVGYQMHNYAPLSSTSYGTYLPFGYMNCICMRNKATNVLKTMYDTMRVYQSGTTVVFSTAFSNVADVAVVGTVSAVTAFPSRVAGSVVTYDFCVTGELTSVKGVSCSTVAFISVYYNNSTAVVAVPSFSSTIAPNDYAKFALSGGYGVFSEDTGVYGYVRDPVTVAVITGSFSSLGGNSNYSKIASVNLTNGTLSTVTHPSGTTVGADIAFDMRSLENSIWFAAEPGSIPSVVYYENLHPSVTDAQSAVGLRTLFAKLYSGSLGAVSIATAYSDGNRPGALFVVRSDTISVPVLVDDVESTTNVPTWQMTVARLLVPFALPVAFVPKKVRLDWTALSAATSGSKLRVWMKDAYVGEYPDIRDPAIYDGSAEEVDGWRLVGTVDPSLTTVTLPITVSGRLATFMFTAWYNMDGVNPASGMSSPVGVGTANLNGVAGTVSGINTGWKPDITLIG